MFSSDLAEFIGDFQCGAVRPAFSLLLQSTLLITLGLLGARILRSRGSAVQSVIYRATLVAVLLCPGASLLLWGAGVDGLALTLPASAPATHEVAGPPVIASADDMHQSEAVPGRVAPDPPAHITEETGALRGEAAVVRSLSGNRQASPRDARPGADQATSSPLPAKVAAVLAGVLTAAWPLVSGLLLLRLLASYGLMARLRRRACEVDAETAARCRRLAARLGVPAPSVLRSASVAGPCLFGLSRPAILLPEGEGSSAAGEILAHELAHLARHDCLWNLLSRVSVAILFFQPLLWLLARRIVRSSEEVCDDHVIGLGFDTGDYARRLADFAERNRLPVSAAAVAVVSLRSWLGRRVVRILDSSRSLSTRVGPRAVAAISIVTIASTTLVGLFGIGGTRAEEPPDATAVNGSPAQADEPSEGKPPAKGTVFLSALGTVVDADGKPVAGAKVYLREWSRARVSESPFDRNPQDVLATQRTAADGTFRFEKVPAPSFERDWSDEAPWDVVVVGEGYGMGWGHLRSAEDKAPVTLKLPEEAKLTGRLVDDQGRPIAGAEVRLHELAGLGSRIRDFSGPADRLDLGWSQLTPRAHTNAKGRFAIGGLPPEMRAILIAEHDQYQREVIYAATTDRTQPELKDTSYSPEGKREEISYKVYTGDFTVELKLGLHVRGRVLFADTKSPCPAAKVMLYFRSRAVHQVADAQGRFAFHGLSEPEWYVFASSPQQGGYLRRRVHVALREPEREAEVQIELPRGQVVTGLVVGEDTRKGIPGVSVYYRSELPDDAPDRLYASSVTTDENGGFRIVVPPGKGRLIISGPVEGYDLPRTFGASQKLDARLVREFDVEPGKPSRDIRFTIARGLVVNGRVTDPQRKPVAGAEVKTVRVRRGGRFKENTTKTDAEGRFTLAGLPVAEAGSLEVRCRERGLFGKASVEADEQATGTRVVNLDVQLLEAATVKGRLLVDGQPMAGIRVDLYQHRTEDGVGYGTGVDHAMTDDAGRFEITPAPPGKRFYISHYSEEFTDIRIRSFDLDNGQVYDAGTFELRRRSMFVAGVVVDPKGNPLQGVRVSARERSGRPISKAFTRRPTGPDGRFRIDGVPNVPLSLMAYFPNPPDSKDRTIRFPARVDATPGDKDIRIVLDPELQLGRPE